MGNSLAEDLDFVLLHTEGIWEELRGGRLFITGGTGFFGTWLLESFCWANNTLNLGATAVVLARNPDVFSQRQPRLSRDPAIQLYQGNVRDFSFPSGEFSHVIHAATPASAALNDQVPLVMLDTIIQGTRRTLDFSVQAGAKKYLLTSSGAVYGVQPPELTRVPEEYCGAPRAEDPRSAYGEGKRAAELLCAIFHKEFGLQTKIARCFAFVGPYLPLDIHFAIGNFIADSLNGGPITVKGDGAPYRSYLYASDLMVWLWTILFKGRTAWPYNVGSDEPFTIFEVAGAVSRAGEAPTDVVVGDARAAGPAPRYVPCTRRALTDLSLKRRVSFAESLAKTIDWHRRAGTTKNPANQRERQKNASS